MIINILAICIVGVPRHPLSLGLQKKFYFWWQKFSSPKSHFHCLRFLVMKFVFWQQNWFRHVYHVAKSPNDEKFCQQKARLFKIKKKLLAMKSFHHLMFSSLNTWFNDKIVLSPNVFYFIKSYLAMNYFVAKTFFLFFKFGHI